MFLLSYILFLLKGCVLFTGSYSVNVFPSTLNKKDEEKYLNQMAMGDKDARSKLIEHNLRLVAHIVKKYENSSYDPDDLISIGTIGLVKGIDSYKMNKKVKLTTYAARCIENEILMHLRSNKKHLNNVSLNDSLGYDKDGNEINLIDVIKMENKDITEEINTKDNVELLYKYINKLTKREKEIIIRRYGLFNNKEMTQKEIAKEIVRNDALDRVIIGLDFFDASINRIAAWTIGTRNMIKALLNAMLMPNELLRKLQDEGNFTERLALMEEFKTYPMGDIWNYYCEKSNVPVGEAWIQEVKKYEEEVLAKRN